MTIKPSKRGKQGSKEVASKKYDKTIKRGK